MTKSEFSGRLWPVHLKPKADELLSSWLVRLAMAHGQKLHTFCSLAWSGKAIWNRDIDKSADLRIIQVLSAKTCTSVERVQATTLSAYEGLLYERHNHYGPTAWIMPVGVYHRTRRQFGLQYCPRCLADDEDPYYRRRWRLAFMVVCEKHHVLLQDRCPRCGAAVNFHRDELGDHGKFVTISLTLCHICGLDLRQTRKVVSPVSSISKLIDLPKHAEVEFTKELLQAIDNGSIQLCEGVRVYSLLYFMGLRQLMKILAMRDKRVERLRQAISKTYGVETYVPMSLRSCPDVQELGIKARRQLLGLSRCLLEEWPHRFIEISQKNKVWSSLWLRHLEPNLCEQNRTAPFWFWSVVHDYLYRARYCPSENEIEAAVKHLKRKEKTLNYSNLSRLLGVAVIRRKKVL